MNVRPQPPDELLHHLTEPTFAPSTDFAEWLVSTFIHEDGALVNEDHAHLRMASIGVLWTNVANTRQMRRIVGQCEIGKPSGAMGRWAKARAEQQIIEWFGFVPDFLLTFDAAFCNQASDATFCAVCEHELYHAAHERDAYGAPKFHRDGSPCFTIRGHDVEEFVGVVERYGARAAGVEAMVQAAHRGPTIGQADIDGACGTCLLRAA